MKNFFRLIPILVLLLWNPIKVSATHVAGVDFSYTCVGQDSFLVTFNAFRDCSGASLGTTANITFSSTCGGNFTQQLTLQNGPTGTEVSQLCPTSIVSSTCNGGQLPGMQQYIYTGIVVLSPQCNTWTMAWSLCCRNTAVNLTGSSNNMYIPATLNSGVDSCNSSPTFNAQPIPYVCLNQVVNYNFGVTEPDGDSIVYTWASPMISNTNPAPFANGYTFNQPLPGITLNPANGQLTFTPTIAGKFVLAVTACEYEYGTGILKGCVTRDIQFVVIACSNQQPLAPPGGISNFTGTGLQLGPDSVEVCVGNNFSFDIVFSDPDLLDSVTLFSNITTVLPGATVSSIHGNPATITVSWIAQPGSAPFNSFIVTGVDDACPTPGIATASYNILVIPSTYAGPDVTICQGTQWAQLGAVGGTLFTWTVLSGAPIDTVPTSPGYNMTCFNCQFPSVSPAVTTTYIVTSNLSGTCVNVDTITINVAPNFNILMPADTLICSIDSVPLPVYTTQPTFTYSYNWSNGGSLSNDTISNPIALPTVSTTYTVTVAAAGCVKTDQVTVDLSPPFPPNISVIGDTVICLGDSTNLTVSLGDVSSSTCGLATTSCMGPVSTGIIGTGTAVNTSTGYPAPYNNFYWGAKHQILYTAAEMQAMGMLTGGKISSIAFNIVTLGNLTTFNNYEVKMGCTNSTDLTSGWETGLVTVLPSYAHSVTLGWNTHTFATPYEWDGVSNIVVQICHNNSSYSSAGTSMSPYTVTTNQSVRYYRADNNSVCSNTTGGTASTSRPNIKFEYCTGADPTAFTYSWSPNLFIDNTQIIDPTVFPPTTTTYSVYVADTFGGCVDTVLHQVQVVTNYNAGFQFNDPLCVDANPDTAQPFVAGGVYSGLGIIDTLLGVFNPGVAGAGSWPVTYTVSSPTGGCVSDSTILVQVINLPDATITPVEICEGSAPDTLSAATPGGTWGGPGITDPVNGIFDPVNLTPGDYDIIYTLTTPCISADTMTLRVIKPYTFVFTLPIISLCQDDSVNLSSNYTLTPDPLQGNGPVVPTWNEMGGAIDPLSGVFDATNLAAGDYTVTLTIAGVNGECGTTQSMIVRVNQIDYPVFPLSLVFCSDENKAIIQVDPWLFGNGTFYTQTPIAPLGANDTLDIVAFGPNGRFDATKSGTGSWELEVTYTNANGCTGVSIDTIYVLDTPLSPTPLEAAYCEGADINLEASGVNTDSIYWYSDAGLVDTLGLGTPLYWGEAPDPALGPITVYLTENNWECVSPVVSYVLPIKESPVAEFQMSFEDTSGVDQIVNVPDVTGFPVTIYGYTLLDVDFNALNIGTTDSVIWNHHAEIQTPSSDWVNTKNPVRFGYAVSNFDPNNPLNSEAFITELIVTNEFGCKDTTEAFIWSVASESVYNVFTPNGDGINDVFVLPVYGMRTYHAEIYNRWGRKVFEWNNPKEGWNGSNQPDGVYYYVVIGERGDGSEYKQQGSVTLTGSGK